MHLATNWTDLRQLDELAVQNTVIHRINPGVKILTTLVFLGMVTSFPKYAVTALLPLLLYPAVLLSLGNLPPALLLKRLLVALPFALFIGLFNPLFDHAPLWKIGAVSIDGGWISLLSILLRFMLAVLAALILIATTGMNAVGAGLLKLGIPKVFILQLLFMYRYIHILLEELSRIIQAYALRSFHGNGLRFKVWGSLLGQLLIRTMERARRIHQAMLCRGFKGEIHLKCAHKLNGYDIAYFCAWSFFFCAARLYNLPYLFGALLMGECP